MMTPGAEFCTACDAMLLPDETGQRFCSYCAKANR